MSVHENFKTRCSEFKLTYGLMCQNIHYTVFNVFIDKPKRAVQL